MTMLEMKKKDVCNKLPIKVFITDDGRCYFYDRNRNKILQIPQELFPTLKKLEDGIISYESQTAIKHLKKKGFLQKSAIKTIYNKDTDLIDNLVNSTMTNLILQVTRDCNFKCRYCSFATENRYDRIHESRYMSEEIAYKCLDFFIQHSTDSNRIDIGFYGGEPLLNFELIKKCVEYAKKRILLKHLSFSCTTNASLLTNDIIDYFDQNSFDLHISFDGPEYIHNKHRRFQINGNATYNTVLEAVKKLRCRNKYFHEHITIVPVIYPDEKSTEIYDFFKSIGIGQKSLNIRPVNAFGTDIKFNLELIKPEKKSIDYSFNEFDLASYEKFKKKIENGELAQPVNIPSGMCIPGKDKLFINTDGDFFPCEKVNELNNEMKIGSLKEGINMHKVKQLANLPVITGDKCKECWAFYFCEMCICHCEDYTCGISRNAKLNECIRQKKAILRYLKMYVKEKKNNESISYM